MSARGQSLEIINGSKKRGDSNRVTVHLQFNPATGEGTEECVHGDINSGSAVVMWPMEKGLMGKGGGRTKDAGTLSSFG